MARGLKLGTGNSKRVVYNGNSVWKVKKDTRTVFIEELSFSGNSNVTFNPSWAHEWCDYVFRYENKWGFRGNTGTNGSGIQQRWFNSRPAPGSWSSWGGLQYWDRVSQFRNSVQPGGHTVDVICEYLKLQGDLCYTGTSPTGEWYSGWHLATKYGIDNNKTSKHFRIRYNISGAPIGFETWDVTPKYYPLWWQVTPGTITNSLEVSIPEPGTGGFRWKLQFVPIDDFSFGLRFWGRNYWESDTWVSDGTTGTNNCIIVTRGGIQHEHQPIDTEW